MQYPLFSSLSELASFLKVSARWLRQEVAANRIPFLQAGRRRLFNADAVLKAIADRAADGVMRSAAAADSSISEAPSPNRMPTIDAASGEGVA